MIAPISDADFYLKSFGCVLEAHRFPLPHDVHAQQPAAEVQLFKKCGGLRSRRPSDHVARPSGLVRVEQAQANAVNIGKRKAAHTATAFPSDSGVAIVMAKEGGELGGKAGFICASVQKHWKQKTVACQQIGHAGNDDRLSK